MDVTRQSNEMGLGLGWNVHRKRERLVEVPSSATSLALMAKVGSRDGRRPGMGPAKLPCKRPRARAFRPSRRAVQDAESAGWVKGPMVANYTKYESREQHGSRPTVSNGSEGSRWNGKRRLTRGLISCGDVSQHVWEHVLGQP